MVEYHPISAKDLSRLHQFGAKVLPGVFLGYVLYAGEIWKGDIVVADIEELEQMDASELYTRRLNAKEVLTPQHSEKFTVHIADGNVKLSVGDQVLRTSTLIRDNPDREARNGFWSISGNYIYLHHVEPKSQTERVESRIIPNSTAIHLT